MARSGKGDGIVTLLRWSFLKRPLCGGLFSALFIYLASLPADLYFTFHWQMALGLFLLVFLGGLWRQWRALS